MTLDTTDRHDPTDQPHAEQRSHRPDDPATVPSRISRWALERPDRPAVIGQASSLTFAELDHRSAQLAQYLHHNGVGADVLVGICMERGIDLVVAVLSVLRSGAAYVPMDPRNPPDRLGFMLEDAGAAVLLTDQGIAAQVSDRVNAPGTRVLCLDTLGDSLSSLPTDLPEGTPDPATLAYVIYTSGSTGRPKGVMVTHEGLANYIDWAVTNYFPKNGGAPLFSSVAFDMVVTTLIAPLAAGRPVHVLTDDVDLGHLGETLDQEGPFDFIKLTPSQLEILAVQLDDLQIARLTTTLVVGGEAFGWDLAEPWTRAGVRVINEYGPTEATVGITVYTATGTRSGPTIPIGRPIPGTSVHLLDEHLDEVPDGEIGEIFLGGIGLARGYLRRPGLTAERFVPDQFGAAGSRLYRTGDRARLLPDGNLELFGRTDDQVKIRGYRIELGEIESAFKDVAGVDAARVLVDRPGDADARLIAYVVLAEQDAARTPAMREALALTLPGYMIPAAFVTVDSFPLTANGKLDRAALPAPQSPMPPPDVVGTSIEQTICRVWAQLLYLDHVGPDSDFFALGGDSLLATRVALALQDALGVDVPVRTVLGSPRLADLAKGLAIATPVTPMIVRR